MARLAHLRLVRLPEQLERRKTGGGGQLPNRAPAEHSARLNTELAEAVETQQRRRRPDYVNPSLILRVRMSGALLEEDWERLGLTVLSSDPDRTLVLFADNDELAEFHRRLGAYAQPIPEGQKNPQYAGFVANIESIGAIEPRDRIGPRFRAEGFTEPNDFAADRLFVVDLELWDLGARALRERKIDQIADYVAARDGEVLDRYVGASITMLRLRVSGALLRTLLTIEDIASLDMPPEPDVTTGPALETMLAQLPPLIPPPDEAPVIGIIDSGLNAHPILDDVYLGGIGVPDALGSADDFGHGTRVAGVAVLGDLRAQLAGGSLTRVARLCSAKVVNAQGRFDDRRLVPSQMREAITRLRREFGCRLFVLALGDTKQPFRGGKVGAWAATLDELARELDVVILVSAGNRAPRGGNRLEQAVTEYPRYLTEDGNTLLEPAGALNVVTVGSLAHGDGIDGMLGADLNIRPITQAMEPSPFTRRGPGAGGACKPDFVDIGGTMILDPLVQRLRGGDDVPAAGVMTLHHRPVDRLFTAGSGTSYAAPMLAFKASQILTLLPNASANLVRALMAGASSLPDPARDRLQMLGEPAARDICGRGYVDLERAAYSDDGRVVLYSEDELPLDHFAVYEVPIPEVFQERGRRTIRISLAYDPPVRHTRIDYAGLGMSFRLVRGCEPAFIFEHFRKREAQEGRFPELAPRFNCALEPGPQQREKATLQTAAITFTQGTPQYGDRYFLVVRCEAGWADYVNRQRFAVVVALETEAEVQLYQRVRVRLPA